MRTLLKGLVHGRINLNRIGGLGMATAVLMLGHRRDTARATSGREFSEESGEELSKASRVQLMDF